MNSLINRVARMVLPFSALLAVAGAQDAVPRFKGATPLEWSVKMADSEMARSGDRHFFGGSNPRARIDYTTAFLGTALVYHDELTIGQHNLPLFLYACSAYLLLACAFHAAMRLSRDLFNLQLTLHVFADIVAITVLMYASAGMKSGLGVMLLISLTGAALVAPRRLTYLYAALAAIAVLIEQGYWVLVFDFPTNSFLQPEIGLTPQEVADWSPFEAQQAPETRITLAVGHDETEPFHIQAQDLVFAAQKRGATIERVTVPGLNHVTMARDLGVPGTATAELLAQCIAQSRG